MTNHEGHEHHEARRGYSMRVPSPLSAEAEALMTRTIGCAIEVHRRLGAGYLESIYRDAMSLECRLQGLPFERERLIHVEYRDTRVGNHRVDLLVGGVIVVELKAVTKLNEVHRAQVISYLKTLGLRGGLLLNFRVAVMRHGIRRIVL